MNKRQLVPSNAETYCNEYNCTLERFNEIKEQFNNYNIIYQPARLKT